MKILDRKTAKQISGGRTEVMQNNKNMNSLAAIIHKNKHNATSNNEKFVHPCTRSIGISGEQ